MARPIQPPGQDPPAGVADETLLDLLAALTPEQRLLLPLREYAGVRILDPGRFLLELGSGEPR